MSPSRGFTFLLRARASIPISTPSRHRFLSALHKIPEAKTQIYLSRSRNPYLNLSIEHHLLTKSPADSTILFLYANEPSIIIGRNQNPWVEVNHLAVRDSSLQPWIVRRRSGGGTVWHDLGNVNYSVICPTSNFDRHKHAEMVVRALRSLNVEGVEVNERHDIIKEVPGLDKPYKVSGSAYKLTRLRSLHHGTCLLQSPNLKDIGMYLWSPGRSNMKARGVDSVRSKITNLMRSNEEFEDAVIAEFQEMYGQVEVEVVGEEESKVPEIQKGLQELKSTDWIYGQTPQFHFSHPVPPATEEIEDHRATDTNTQRASLPKYPFNIAFIARNGVITEAMLQTGLRDFETDVDSPTLSEINPLKGVKVHDIHDWQAVLDNAYQATYKSSNTGDSNTDRHLDKKHQLASHKESVNMDIKTMGEEINKMFGVGDIKWEDQYYVRSDNNSSPVR